MSSGTTTARPAEARHEGSTRPAVASIGEPFDPTGDPGEGATIHDAVLETAARFPERNALVFKRGGTRLAMTYRELAAAVESAAFRIRSLGLCRGDAAGILAPNGPGWIIADLAILRLGGVVVPVYPDIRPDRLRSMIADCGMRLLFVGGMTSARLAGLPDRRCGLRRAVLLEEVVSARVGPGDGNRSLPAGGVVSGDTATIVYTSGTTGEPHGVVLTHGNIVSNARAVIERFGLTCRDSIVSYLPLAHMFERTCGHYALLFAGGTVAYAEDPGTVLVDVAAVRPTVMIAVPRVLERAYGSARIKVERGPRVGRMLVCKAVAALHTRALSVGDGGSAPLASRLQWRLYDALVASRVRRIGGGRLRLIVSGGAALDPRIGRALRALGFPLVEGYGLTEASPVVASGIVPDHIPGTVGRPLRGVAVRISPEGEILVRGPNVMRGILNRPDATREALAADGWLRTGDLGEFDASGNLVVTGRSKEIIVTSCGRKVAPGPVEGALAASPYIEQAMVLGDGRKCIAALIVPRRAAVERYAAGRGIAGPSYESILETEPVRALIRGEVARANRELAPYERVAGFALLAGPFSEENGMLTPTLKLRRGRIAESNAGRIAALYRGLEGTHAH